MNFAFQKGVLCVTHEKVPVVFGSPVTIEDYAIDFPGEYEKSGIIAEVREFADDLAITRLTMGDRTVLHLPDTCESLTSPMIEFAGNVDVLITPGKKELQKNIETIDARVVIPYGSGKSSFLGALGQSVEPQDKQKLKAGDFDDEKTLFIDLVE